MVDAPPFRILIVVPGFPGADDEWFIPGISEVVAEMAKLAEVQVISLFHPSKKGEGFWRGIPVQACGLRRGGVFRWSWAARWGVRAALKTGSRFRPDAVLSFWATEAASVGMQVAGALGVPGAVYLAGGELVYRLDIPYGDARHTTRRQRILASLKGAEHVFVGSRIQESLAFVGGGVPREKLHCVPLGFSSERFGSVSIPGVQEGARPTFISVADLLPVKGHDLQLQALRLLPELDLRLRWVGMSNPSTDLEAAVSILGEEDRVEFAGTLHHQEIPQALAEADVFVQTSHWESQGIALLEAMASGVPVITTAVGIAPEALGVAGCGTLLRGRTAGELADAMERMATNLPAEREAARKGAQRIQDTFGAARSAERILERLR